MQTKLTSQQIESYRKNGYLLVENFASEEELSFWHNGVTEAIKQCNGQAGNLGDLKWVKGSFPTPLGIVTIMHTKLASGKVRTEYHAPAGVKVITR